MEKQGYEVIITNHQHPNIETSAEWFFAEFDEAAECLAAIVSERFEVDIEPPHRFNQAAYADEDTGYSVSVFKFTAPDELVVVMEQGGQGE